MGLLCIGMLLLTACKDDDFYGGKYCPEGEPATISLKVLVPDMGVKTRTAMSDEDAAKVNDLWIAIYNVRTGNRTGLYYQLVTDETKNMHDMYSLDNTINALSGESRIVAVANVTGNNVGYCSEDLVDENGVVQITAGSRSQLKQLLEQADTWDKFTAISAAHLNPRNVFSFEPNLIMAGTYQDSPDGDVSLDNNHTVIINAGKQSLDGAIHLRRLLSYVEFNIKKGEDDDINNVYGLEVKLKSWKVCNNPTLSYLHEQEKNAGDVASYLTVEGKNGVESNYASSAISYDFATGEGNIVGKFDFYQYENKHRGLESVTKYEEREKEHPVSETDKTNSGIYASLCTSTAKDAIDYPNNFASYVEIEAEVSYYKDSEKKNLRTGNVTYRIHLGYCEGELPEKARDFNCYRNTKYTYNVTIKGLNKVVVEAKKTNEDYQHGVEGDVYDTDMEVIDLDAHYGMFNISLSNKERKNLQYIIRAPYDNEVKKIRRYKEEDSDEYKEEGKEGQELFYQWIRFRPTTNETVLAVYKNTQVDGLKDDPWTLDELIDVDNNKHTDGKSDNSDDETERWYTVFIDENVYHGQNGSDERGNEWWKYVNKDPRTIYLSIQTSNVSEDQNSRYGKAKYMIRQKSIQTYYTTTGQYSPTALGVEHTDETYGLNLRWTLSRTGWNADNGRMNVWTYVQNKQWNDFVDTDIDNNLKLASVPEIDNEFMKIKRPATTYNTFKLKPIQGTFSHIDYDNPDDKDNPKKSYDPNKEDDYYEAMNLCLSRNRDLNGNGQIDVDELRWYLPAMGKYARIVLGRHSLEDPLIDPNDFDPASFTAGAENSCFHYISSDGLILWAEEGLSIEKKGLTGGKYRSAWGVRCIRNLGVNLNEVVQNDPIQMAYVHDEQARTFTMQYYDVASIRTQPMKKIPIHDIVSPLNLPYYKFQYAEKDCENPLTDTDGVGVKLKAQNNNGYVLDFGNNLGNSALITAAVWSASVAANSICGLYSEKADGSDKGEWRVPNQKELTMMRREEEKVFKVLPQDSYMWQWISCSKEFLGAGDRILAVYYNNNRSNSGQYWSNTGNTEYYTEGSRPNTFTHVRCVRDVVE